MLFPFISLMWYTDPIVFQCYTKLAFSVISRIWLWFIISFVYLWIWFVNISLGNIASIFMRPIGLEFFFFVMSLSGIKGLSHSESMLQNVSSFPSLCKRSCNVAIIFFFSFNALWNSLLKASGPSSWQENSRPTWSDDSPTLRVLCFQFLLVSILAVFFQTIGSFHLSYQTHQHKLF